MASGRINTGCTVGKRESISVAGAADVTLTDTQARSDVIELTGAITAAIAVLIPLKTGQRIWIVNLTTGNFALTVKNLTGTGIAVAGNNTKKGALLYYNGTNVQRLSADVDTTV